MHNFFNQNEFSHSYKTDERIIKNIIANNVQCSNESDTLKFIPYLRSNTITKHPTLKKNNLIYQYQSLHGDCEHRNNIYIEMTSMTLSQRPIMHTLIPKTAWPGGQANHNLPLTREDLVNKKILLTEFSNNQSTGTNRTIKLFV